MENNKKSLVDLIDLLMSVNELKIKNSTQRELLKELGKHYSDHIKLTQIINNKDLYKGVKNDKDFEIIRIRLDPDDWEVVKKVIIKHIRLDDDWKNSDDNEMLLR